MLHHDGQQYLQFSCGPFTLMLPINSLAEIASHDDALCAPTGNPLLHHGQTSTWRNTVLPYIDLRLALRLPHEQLGQPSNILVLCDTENQQPVAIIAVDNIAGFVTPQASEWYQTHGINSEIDIFFDRLHVEKQNGSLTMCLGHPSQWLHKAVEMARLNPSNNTGGTLHAD